MREPAADESFPIAWSLALTAGTSGVVGALVDHHWRTSVGPHLAAAALTIWAARASRRGSLVPLAALPLAGCLAWWTGAALQADGAGIWPLVFFLPAILGGAIGAVALDPPAPGLRDTVLGVAHAVALISCPIVTWAAVAGGSAPAAWAPPILGCALALASLARRSRGHDRSRMRDGDFDDEVGKIYLHGIDEPLTYRAGSPPGGPVVVVTAAPEREAGSFRASARDGVLVAVLAGTTRELLHAQHMEEVCARLVTVVVSLTPTLTTGLLALWQMPQQWPSIPMD